MTENLQPDSISVPLTSKKLQTSVYQIDRCLKYFPRYDGASFAEQIQYTEGQLLSYLPQQILQFHKEFKSTQQYVNIGFWTVDLLLVTTCHKASFLSKLLGKQSWKMFTFKALLMLLPYQLLKTIEKDVFQQHIDQIYSNTKVKYRKYKQNGDIMDLRGNIELHQGEITDLEKIGRLNQFPILHGWKANTYQTTKKQEVV